VTHQNEKLKDLNENNGKNSSLLVGNGERLKILASGTTKLNNFNLHNVLYVPKITKKLLSVSKLIVDNNALVEFDANYCYVDYSRFTWIFPFKRKSEIMHVFTQFKNPNESPYSLLFGKKLDYDALKSFDCAYYPCLKPYNQHKL